MIARAFDCFAGLLALVGVSFVVYGIVRGLRDGAPARAPERGAYEFTRRRNGVKSQ